MEHICTLYQDFFKYLVYIVNMIRTNYSSLNPQFKALPTKHSFNQKQNVVWTLNHKSKIQASTIITVMNKI